MFTVRYAVALFTLPIIAAPLAFSWADEVHQDHRPTTGPVEQPVGKDRPAAKRPGFTIAKETTYITEPLTADGYPDYFAAWEREYSRGVTSENNAVVTLLRALGPNTVSESHRDEYFGKLGVSPPPETGKYFILQEEFTARRRAKDVATERNPESANLVTSRETAADDIPAATKAWLAEIDEALNIAVEASKRTCWYEPLLTGEEPSMLACAGSAFAYSDIPGYLPLDLAIGLLHRVVYRIEEGKHDDALQDLLAAHRLASLISQCPGNRSGYSACAINAVACGLDVAIASSGKVPRTQAEQYFKELQQLSPPAVLVRQFEYKRFLILEGMTRIRRNGILVLASFAGEPRTRDPEWKELLAHASESDRPLKIANSMIDLLITAAREPAYRQQVPKVELAQYALLGMEWLSFSEEKPPTGAEWSPRACERPAIVLLNWGLQDQFLDESAAEQSGMLYPPFVRQSRAAARFELATVSWALALYRAEQERYPETLAECCPRHLPQVPRDPFRDAPLIYRREGDRFVLYSVGPNGQDDGCTTTGARLDLPQTDDIFLVDRPHSEPAQESE